jgi:RNA polymerase sigma factor (sigma-70 family)
MREALDTPSQSSPEGLSLLSTPIQTLPTRQKEVFILRHFHEFSTSETAKILQISEGTVKSTLSDAVQHLKQQLEKYPEEHPTENGSHTLKKREGEDS